MWHAPRFDAKSTRGTPMSKPEWGVKRSCPSCGARFYDLMRDPIICPKCGAEYDESVAARPKRAKAEPVAKAPEVEEEPELVEEETLEQNTDAAAEPDVPLAEADGEAGAATDVDGDDEELGDFDDDGFLEEEEDDPGLEGLEEVGKEDDDTT
jgi:uncharacterized protein (TIGR02300 family)